MKIFVFAAVAVALLQIVSGDDEGCHFDPVEACNHCDFSRSYVQYARNECNCTEYYSCEKTRGVITAHKQTCARCLCFSDTTWGCTEYNSEVEGCPQETPITEEIWHQSRRCFRYGNGPSGLYLQEYEEAADPHREIAYNWIVNNYPVEMPCPPGTWFNFQECKCINCDGHIPCAGHNPIQFTLDFEDWFNANKRTWYAPHSTCSVFPPVDDRTSNHVLVLNGNGCDLEIPYFQKNEFSEFTFCGEFKRDVSGRAGLVFDGGMQPGDDCLPSIFIILGSDNRVFGGFHNSYHDTFSVTHPLVTDAGTWYRVCLRYSGSYVDLYLAEQNSAGTSVSTAANGNTRMNRCNMVIGAEVWTSGESYYFRGQMDNWCFSRSYLNPIPNCP